MNPLSVYGWTSELEARWNDLAISSARPARVLADFGTSLRVALPDIVTAELSGKLAHYTNRDDSPKVGDWVVVESSSSGHVVVDVLLPRRSELSRKAAGHQTEKQILAVNVDIAFVLLAVGNDFSIERLRRFLYQLSVSSIKPVIVLNKIDTTDDLDGYVSQLETFDLPVVPIAASSGHGVDKVLAFIKPGVTAVLLGSSGVGKSTLTNQLVGEGIQKTQSVRSSDETGKHTTVHRELFILPNGGLLIDMPGIREFQLWGTEEDLKDNFDDITELARRCKYSSCHHSSEDGCAVKRALEDGSLELSRYNAYLKMKHELQSLEKRAAALRKRTAQRSHKLAVRRRDYESRRTLRNEINE